VDTAGLELDGRQAEGRAAIEAQTRVAVDEAQAIVFMVDVRAGLTAIDRDVAELLRRSRRPVVVVANKADRSGQEYFRHEILELGFRDVLLVSADHGIGVDDLLDRLLELLPDAPPVVADPEAASLAIMGRPNVGKSSLLNALLGDERALVAAAPGTTRDPVDTVLTFDGLPVVLVSAKTGEGVGGILPAALEVVGQRRVRVPTNELNRVLREAFLSRPPPSFKGRRLTLRFATQAESETPTIVLFVNDTNLLHFSYRRYLEKALRARFGFAGNPIRIVLRAESSRRSPPS